MPWELISIPSMPDMELAVDEAAIDMAVEAIDMSDIPDMAIDVEVADGEVVIDILMSMFAAGQGFNGYGRFRVSVDVGDH